MPVPFTQLLSTYLENYDTKLNNALKRANGVVAIFGAKGRIKMETGGGDNFKTRVMYAGNPNVGFGDPNASVNTNKTDGITMSTVPQKFIRGAIVIGDVDRDRAAQNGEWAIGNLIADNAAQAETAYTQTWADALLQAAPGGNDPLTLLPSAAQEANGILSPQAGASQTGTTAGIARTNSWWRNGYSNTSMDISAEAGRASLGAFYLSLLYGNSREDEPDFGLTSGAIISDLYASFDTNRRATYQDSQAAKLGFDGIMFQNAMLIREVSSRLDSKVAFINTRDLYLKFLASTNKGFNKEQWNQDNNLGNIPVNVGTPQHDIDTFNTVTLFYAVASLIPAQLRTHGLADNVV